MRIKAILSVSAVVLALFAGAAQATLITRDVMIDLETDGRIKAFSNQDSWEGIVSIEDTNFSTGDTLLLNIRFANSKSLELSNSGTNPLNNGLELTKLSLLFETPNGADYRASGFFTYVGVDGDLLSNPTYWDISGGGGAFRGPFWLLNLTDTSFSYSGINIEINFDPSSINEDFFECRMPPCIFDRLEWSSSAEDVRIVDAAPVPEPTTILLLGTGLIGLAGFRRKFKE